VRKRAAKFGLEIVMVNVWEHVDPRREALHFCKIHNNVVVDKKGIVRAVGVTTPDEVRATLTKLLLPFG
jgi:hypothetical protein